MPHGPSKSPPQGLDTYRYAGLGLQFAGAILILTFLGYWLDRKLGTSPWLLIAGVFAGFTGGLISLLRQVPPPRGRPPSSPPAIRPPDRAPSERPTEGRTDGPKEGDDAPRT